MDDRNDDADRSGPCGSTEPGQPHPHTHDMALCRCHATSSIISTRLLRGTTLRRRQTDKTAGPPGQIVALPCAALLSPSRTAAAAAGEWIAVGICPSGSPKGAPGRSLDIFCPKIQRATTNFTWLEPLDVSCTGGATTPGAPIRRPPSAYPSTVPGFRKKPRTTKPTPLVTNQTQTPSQQVLHL
ncbi:hypothetical protein BKA80DRAFT_47033 [Phyllosticta citrichinensis]